MGSYYYSMAKVIWQLNDSLNVISTYMHFLVIWIFQVCALLSTCAGLRLSSYP